MPQEEPKFKKLVNAADGLSLGISMVVAVLMFTAKPLLAPFGENIV